MEGVNLRNSIRWTKDGLGRTMSVSVDVVKTPTHPFFSEIIYSQVNDFINDGKQDRQSRTGTLENRRRFE